MKQDAQQFVPIEWLKALTATDLSDRAVRVANALALIYVNRKSGQCNPKRMTLADRLSVSEDTVKRALAELRKKGWLIVVGHRHGSADSYRFVTPAGNVVALPVKSAAADRRNQPRPTDAKGGQDCHPSQKGKGGKSARERGANLPLPIYEPDSEPEARARPAPHLAVLVVSQSWQADEWNAWLVSHGRPLLSELRSLHVDGGYCLPWQTPPKQGDGIGESVAIAIIEWAKAGDHAHAA